jgi:trehalose 6-phosphate synthase/phosphatase
MADIISVANRLPVTIGKKIKKSSGGLVSAMEGLKGNHNLKWIGWPGASVKSPKKAADIEQQLRDDYGCIPVFLTKKEVTDYYHGFSNSSLWPLLHYMGNYVRHDRSWWQQYEQVNQRFCDFAASEAKAGDIVWVHDYHLMLMPAMLRKKIDNIKIGFFLHTPFPSYEVFRCHPHRYELLEGLLGADLVGFHTYGYMRHFKSSVTRLLGLETEMARIHHQNRYCHTGVYPIGINSQAFIDEQATTRFKRKKIELEKTYKKKRIVLSVERLDYTKGLPRRLEAIDRFLAKWKDKDNIVFIFVSVPSRGEVKEYQLLREQIEGLVGRINGRHSTVKNTPIHFIHKPVPFTELCALYALADVCMVTPLIDGMNLVAKEYVACKKDAKGVLMLSEFAGAAEELFKAISVNPYDVDQMADRLKQALTVPEAEKIDRMKGIYERVMEYDAKQWGQMFLDDLHKIEPHIEVKEPENVEHEIVERFKKSKKAAFFIDYDGTLSDFYNNPRDAYPRSEAKSVLTQLEEQEDIDTFIVSGRNMEMLSDWLGKYNFTLLSEHGYRFKLPGSDQVYMLSETADLSWKEKVKPVLEYYAGSTPGSFVEEKVSALVWHYRRSDPEFGQWKAHQLLSSLYELIANLPAEVHHGKKIVEVSSMQVNKGVALETFIREKNYDFILAAGDDQTDETMFAIENDNLTCVKVGPGDSRADFRIKNPHLFRQLLTKLIQTKSR